MKMSDQILTIPEKVFGKICGNLIGKNNFEKIRFQNVIFFQSKFLFKLSVDQFSNCVVLLIKNCDILRFNCKTTLGSGKFW